MSSVFVMKIKFREVLSSKFFFWLILSSGLILRILWILLYNPQNLNSDAIWYFQKACSIADGNGYMHLGQPTALYPVGYPALLGFLFFIFGKTVIVGQTANLLFSVLIILLIRFIAIRVSGSLIVANLSAVFIAFHPNFIAYNSLLFNELAWCCALLGSFLLFLKAGEKKNYVWDVLSGILFAVLCYLKPQSFLVPVLLIFSEAIFIKTRHFAEAVFIRKAIIQIMVMLICILPWSIRNGSKVGSYYILTSNTGFNLLIGNNPYAKGNYSPDTVYFKNLPQVNTEAGYNRMARNKALVFISQNPGKFISLIPSKLYYFFKGGVEGLSWNIQGLNGEKYLWLKTLRHYTIGAHVLFLLVLAFSFIRLFFRKSPSKHFFVFWLLVYFMLVTIVFFGESRFLMPLIPLLGITAIDAMVEIFKIKDGSNPAISCEPKL